MTDKDILTRYNREKKAATQARKAKESNWLANEDLYNGVVSQTLITRSNIHVPMVFESVQTQSARLGTMPKIRFETKPEGDENAAQLMESLWQEKARDCNLEEQAQIAKTENGLYGRGIFKAIPSASGVTYELVDTLAFLISPVAYTSRSSQNCGQQFIYKTIEQLEEDAESFGYNTAAIKKLKKMANDAQTASNDETSQRNARLASLGFRNLSMVGVPLVELTEWYTTVKGEKRVWTVANDKFVLRDIPLIDLGLDNWPFYSFCTFPRNVAFWVPGVADVERDPNLAVDVITNQIIDNNTYRNFGMMFVDSQSGLKQNSLNPRPLGITPVTVQQGKSISDTVYQWNPPEITDAVNVLGMIRGFADSAAGLSFGAPGAKGKKSTAQQQQEQAMLEQTQNLARQSYLRCFQEMADDFAVITKRVLTTPIKVKYYGNAQLTVDGVTKANFENTDFVARAQASESAKENKAIKQKAMAEMFGMFKGDPDINQRELKRIVLKDFDQDSKEIEVLLSGNPPPPGMPMPIPGQMPGMPGQPQPQPGAPQAPVGAPAAPPGANMPTNPNGPILSAVQQQAQASVSR